MQKLIDAYWAELHDVAGFANSTVENYIRCLDKYFHYARNELQIDPLTAGPKHLLQWMIHLKSRRSGMSRSTMTNHKSALVHFFALLIKLKKRDHNPADALFTIRKRKSELNQPIREETALHLVRSVDRTTWLGERNFMIISLLWALGLRIGELTALRVSSFEPDIESGKDIGLLRIVGKGKKERALFVVDKLYRNLLDYLAYTESPKQSTHPMFPTHTNKNKAVSPNRVQKIMKQIVQEIGIEERITPHVLRHSFATHLYARGVPVAAIEGLLGHDSTDETSIYIHVPVTKKQQALQKIRIDGSAACP